MKKNGSNLLVLFNKKTISQKEADGLSSILLSVESPGLFSTVHELVDRNRITADQRKILKESGRRTLRTFRFLIKKN